MTKTPTTARIMIIILPFFFGASTSAAASSFAMSPSNQKFNAEISNKNRMFLQEAYVLYYEMTSK
jgi:hypothetical protein